MKFILGFVVGFMLGAIVVHFAAIAVLYEVWEVPAGQYATTFTLSGGGDFKNYEYPHVLIVDVYADSSGSPMTSYPLTRLGASVPAIEKERITSWNEAVRANSNAGHPISQPITMLVSRFDNYQLVAARSAGFAFTVRRMENNIPYLADYLMTVTPRREVKLAH